jgi:hypothetical protein
MNERSIYVVAVIPYAFDATETLLEICPIVGCNSKLASMALIKQSLIFSWFTREKKV